MVRCFSEKKSVLLNYKSNYGSKTTFVKKHFIFEKCNTIITYILMNVILFNFFPGLIVR